MGTVNVDGLRRKKSLVDNLLLVDHVLVLGITETKASNIIHIKGYQVYQRDFRQVKQCGGVALAIHRSIPAEPLVIPEQFKQLPHSSFKGTCNIGGLVPSCYSTW